MPWYHGNLHCHSCKSDGQSPPPLVAAYYKQLGHHFVGISDHNSYTPIEEYSSEGILPIPCCEYTGKEYCHVLAAGVTDAVAPNLDSDDIWERMNPDRNMQKKLRHNRVLQKVLILQDGINKTRAAGGIPIICHPLWKWAFNHQELSELSNCTHIEICNASTDCNAFPLPGKSHSDEMWDALLSSNIRIIGLASDDAHTHTGPYSARIAIGGRGWNVVKAKSLTRENILAAITKGHFYATTGIILASYIVARDRIRVRVDVIDHEKTCIQFFGQGGRELQCEYESESEYFFDGNETYVRCRISSTAGLWAWTQPVFMDELDAAVDWTTLS
jgi:hypothetical protein